MAKREYIQANKDWLEAKTKEDGVKALPKGIYYKVLSEGNQDSAKPTARSIITAHYTGRTIDGKQFDSSHGGAIKLLILHFYSHFAICSATQDGMAKRHCEVFLFPQTLQRINHTLA